MSKFQRSWLLFKSSISIITQNRKLLLFPIVISVASAVIVLFFVAPALLRPTGFSYGSMEHWKVIGNTFFTVSASSTGAHAVHLNYSPTVIAYLVFLYLVSMFLATFFNVAFYNEILAALNSQPVSLSRGLKFACTRYKAILMWTLFAGLVGLIIKTIEQRLDIAGRIIAKLIGITWSIASVFVIPIMVRDQQAVNPVAMLKKSAAMLKRTWGEALIGYAGIAFGNLIVLLISLVLLAGATFVSIQLNNFWLLAATVGFWLMALIAWSYLTNIAGLVFKGALYLYAAEGIVPRPYNKEMLDAAWKFKKS
jgi:hypothetical protein